MVRFENVGVRYGMGPEVLQDVSFRLEPGSFHFLTGPSGAGKTSLLRLMYLALPPSRGLITMFDQDIATAPRAKLPELRRQIGVVFQDFHLLDHLTAMENVALTLRVAGDVSNQKITEHVTELLTWVGLADKLNAYPPTLSGGEKQRVAIARAVIGRPRFLLADEPTGSVDGQMGMRLMRLFVELNRLGTAIVIASHDENLVAKFGYPILRIEDGRVSVEDPSIPKVAMK